MWCLVVLCLVPLVSWGDCNQTPSRGPATKRLAAESVAVTMRPDIYNCRSPNMEDFTCRWRSLGNVSNGDDITYTLTYSKDKGPLLECPDYISGGPFSCHFDSEHTSIWKIYCMNVTAVTTSGNYTSLEHCLDVAEIVQTEPPVNLSFSLQPAGGDELGHNLLLSWSYPVPADLQFGWITLIYELQYRRLAQPHVWKVKPSQRETHVELLGLPVGDYAVRVRCRSHNYGIWSRWSHTLLLSIPAPPPTGKLLVLLLVAGVGIVALLVIGFGVIPQGKRIKAYFLPPIPKPRIMGIDPLLLKKGHLEEINNHFLSFHGYHPPAYSEEEWHHVSTDDTHGPAPPAPYPTPPGGPPPHRKDAIGVLGEALPPRPALGLSSYCTLHSKVDPALPEAKPTISGWAWPGIVPQPGTDYSMMGFGVGMEPQPHPEPPACPPHNLYTCVQLMNDSGGLHLVPCLTPQAPPPCRHSDQEEGQKKKHLEDYFAWKGGSVGTPEGTARDEVPSHPPVATGNTL